MTTEAVKQEAAVPVSRQGDEDMRQYLREIREYPLLTPEEEREIAIRCAEGNQEAIRLLVNSNLRLVVSVAREYVGRGVPLLDLIQEGSIGLLVAAKKFDYTMDCRFSTYATKWIRQGITRCLFNHAGLIRVPVHTAERIRKMGAAQARFLQEKGREPTDQELGALTELPVDKVKKYRELTPEVCSLDTPVGNREDGTMGAFLADTAAEDPQAELVRRQMAGIMEKLLLQLNERQQKVLRLHFGMDDGVCHSLEEIGRILGVSKERTRQVERQAIEKLQKLGASYGLEDFLD